MIHARVPCFVATAVALSVAMLAAPASAQTRAETMRFVTGGTVNTLDPTSSGPRARPSRWA
jgi:peptide/nickel transport system substrate-binding protein